MRIERTFVALLTLAVFLAPFPPALRSCVAASESAQEKSDAKVEAGLRFRLSESAVPAALAPTPNALAPAARLSDAETETLLARLPPIKEEADDAQDFRLRERSLPAPRAGRTIQTAFAAPQPNASPTPLKTNAPLEILRFAPEGETQLAPVVSVTFSQPMVAVSSQDEAAHVPVSLSPQPAEKWRWLGAQTLIFQPEAEGGRMPMATDYTLTVPAGTKSALGNALGATKVFRFSTPPPVIINSYPRDESVAHDALMFLEFNQRIDAARVLANLRVPSLGSGAHLRLATQEEINADDAIKALVKDSTEGRWLASPQRDADGRHGNVRARRE
jgi:hypothetical protein